MKKDGITIKRYEIIRSKNRYYCNPYLCGFAGGGFALLYHDAPSRDSTVKIDPKGILNMITGPSPTELSERGKRQVPRIRSCGTAPTMIRIDEGRYLISDNLWHVYNWMGEPEVKVATDLDWVLTLRGAITMVVDAAGERVKFGKPRFVKCRDYPVVAGYDAPILWGDGSILLACDYDEDASQKFDYPWESVIMRSDDLGRTWKLHGMTYCGKEHEDLPQLKCPSIALKDDGTLICALSAVMTGSEIYICRSENGGADWSLPSPAGIKGNAHSLRVLKDGLLLMTFSSLEKPFGIKARLSEDGGRSWPESNSITIDDDTLSNDCGWARAMQNDNGEVFVSYFKHVTRKERAVMVARVVL